MKIILETKYNKIQIEVPLEDLTVSQVVEKLIRPAMLAIGFNSDTLIDVLGEINDEAL